MEFCSGFYKAASENKNKQTVSKVFAINLLICERLVFLIS